MTLERAKQIIQENFGDKYDVEFNLTPANIQQLLQPDNGYMCKRLLPCEYERFGKCYSQSECIDKSVAG